MIYIYKASAGSGKTFQLTRHYLTLLLGEKIKGKKDEHGNDVYRLCVDGNKRHRHILAITFTNKATEEMKRRIVHELAVLAGMEPGWDKPSDHAEALISLFHCTEEQLREASRKALYQLLYDFSFFNVSTIDAFFQTILRTFAREAELTGNFELEIDENFAINSSVAKLLSDISREDAETSRKSERMKWVISYMAQLARDGKAFNVFNRSSTLYETIVRLIRSMLDEKLSINADDMTRYLDDPAKLKTFVKELNHRRDQAHAIAKQKALDLLNAIKNCGVAPADLLSSNFFKTISEWASKGWHVTSVGKPSQTLYSVSENPEKAFTKTSLKKFGSYLSGDIESLASEAAEGAIACFNNETFVRITLANLSILGLLGDVLKNMREYCNDNNLFLLSNTNDLLRRIIGEDDVPFIYERIGVWLNHYLIDEFQDTSYMQWLNLKPLIGESVGNDDDNLIIGDQKQCIYRFRNSDPELLGSTVQSDFDKNIPVGDDITENTNWRSSAEVVRFNNTLFSAMAENLGYDTSVYSNVVQQIAPKRLSHRGYVKFTPIEGNAPDFEKETLTLMCDEIKRQLQSGYRPCDIAVLTRSRKDARAVISCLLERSGTEGYPTFNVISDDSLEIASSPAVKFIISVMRYLTASDIASGRKVSAKKMAAIVNRYEYLLSSHTMSREEALRHAIPENDTPADRMSTDLQSMRSNSLITVVENIIREYISDEDKSSQNMFITAFEDIVSDYCERGEGDLQSFLEWWDTTGKKATVSSPPDETAIRVLTIHKSKGLEFPCVHVPFATWQCVNDYDLEWFLPAGFEGIDPDIVPPLLPLMRTPKMIGTPFETQYMEMVNAQLLDELNTTYVAFTRAIDELIVQYNPQPDKNIGGRIATALSTISPEYIGRLNDIYSSLLPAESPTVFITETSPDPGETFIVGTPTVGRPTEKVKLTAIDPSGTLSMPQFRSLERNDIWETLNIDRPERDFSAPRDRGTILHDIMAQVRHIKDLDCACRRAVARGLVPASHQEEVYEYLKKQIRRPEVDEWFNGFSRVLMERTLIDDDEDSRPDRVVWTSSGTIDVIDYKTGAEHHKRYSRQVKGYMEILQRIFPDDVVRGFLWYLDTGNIVEV